MFLSQTPYFYFTLGIEISESLLALTFCYIAELFSDSSGNFNFMTSLKMKVKCRERTILFTAFARKEILNPTLRIIFVHFLNCADSLRNFR